jgi:2-dehydropantoate 2-reductase
MHFLVVGPGAMGCLFAARLKNAGHDVTLLDYIPERAEQINRQGILVQGVTGEYKVQVPTLSGTIPNTPDLVLLCVKSYKTREAAQAIKEGIGPQIAIVTLQNGVGNVEILQEIFGKERVLGGVTAEGATLLGPGKIRHAGRGETIVGPGRDPNGPAEKLVSAFNHAGFRSKSANHVSDLIWGKLIVNVGINPLAAITGLKNGHLPELPGTRMVMEEAVKEAVAVAQAKGIDLPYPDPLARVIEVCRATAGNVASMLQDVLNRRQTEIDAINGAIVREGKALGLPTPVNLTLASLVQAIQDTYQERV